ncbi:hypothetical protein RIF29_14914 [Crotalaria pallida]|uniref:Uncharacterized protein n=1 Tax=Crotalaria pallida TaxID=3830 RepID=A0AAN9IE61_CROPI
MAKKRGRPPKSPSPQTEKRSSTAKLDAQKLDLTCLDQQDLETIDNLSAKQLEALMQGLELIKARVHGKGQVETNGEEGVKVKEEEGINANPKMSTRSHDENNKVLQEERHGLIPEENRVATIEEVNKVLFDASSSKQPVVEDGKEVVNSSPTPSVVPQSVEEKNSDDEWTPVKTRGKGQKRGVVKEGVSDHSPAIMTWGAKQWERGGIFKFLNMLAKDSDFLRIVQDAWLFDESELLELVSNWVCLDTWYNCFENWFRWVMHGFRDKKRKCLVYAAMAAAIYHIWMKRNRRQFTNQVLNPVQVFVLLKRELAHRIAIVVPSYNVCFNSVVVGRIQAEL